MEISVLLLKMCGYCANCFVGAQIGIQVLFYCCRHAYLNSTVLGCKHLNKWIQQNKDFS